MQAKLLNNQIGGRRNKSTVRGANDYSGPQLVNQNLPVYQANQGLKRNNSKPQL